MKELMGILLTFGFLGAMSVQPLAAAPDGDAEARYQAMLAAAKADPTTADYRALRFAYADRPAFSPTGTDGARSAMKIARAARNWQGLLDAASRTLQVDWVDGAAHLDIAAAYAELGRPDDSDRERQIGVAIFQSMMQDGDGRSSKHAFVVVSIAEEYELIEALGRRLAGTQALVCTRDHSYDTIETTGRHGGDKVRMWFQIDRVAEARILQPDSADRPGP